MLGETIVQVTQCVRVMAGSCGALLVHDAPSFRQMHTTSP